MMSDERDRRLDRLYDLLPVVYRQRDTEIGQPLRALLQVVAEQTNVVEDDIAQLYENWFIETCQEWAVPYIADLIGYRPVHEAGETGAISTEQGAQRNKILVPRREVASTIRYRRRKGTLALLELLARDVAGWPARAAEFYQWLAASQHVNHPRPASARTLDLRHGDALERLGGAFDEAAHTAAVRRLNSRHTTGRHNITNTGLFVWRLRPYSVTRAPAFCIDRARHHYTFSVLGNDAPLFTKPIEEPDPTHVADEMNVPAPVRRRALDERTADYYGRGKSLYIWRDGTTRPVPLERVVVADLSRWAYRPQGNQVAVDPVLGRIAFSPRAEPRTGVWVTYHYGFSAEVGGGEYERHLRPPLGRAVYRVSQQYTALHYVNSIGRALEAWRADDPDDAVIQIDDSGAYVEQIEIRLRKNQRLEIRAANGTRPAVRLLNIYTNRPDALSVYGPSRAPAVPYEYEPETESPEEYPPDDYEREERQSRGREERRPKDNDARGERASQDATGAAAATAEQQQRQGGPDARLPRLTLDGLLVIGRGMTVEGDLAEVLVRHCTFVPGWSIDAENSPESETEPSIELSDTGAQLNVEHSIVGSIVVDLNEVAAEPVNVRISDSVLDAARPDLEALSGPDNTWAHARLSVLRSTVVGRVRTHAVELAENSIFTAAVNVARTQTGCVRFCYLPPGSRTPRRYNCQPDAAAASLVGEKRAQAEMRVRPQFNSLRYGTPVYCQLSETCPEEIRRGADDESEMGVFHDLFQPQREANLRARLDEYTPAGMDAGVIFAT